MFSLLLAVAVASADPSPPTCGIDSWVPFQWAGSNKSALLVHATLNGKRTRFQFDTGADVSVLYGKRVAKIFGTEPVDPPVESDEEWHQIQAFSFDGRPPRAERLLMVHDMRGGRQFAGTIGSDLLIGKVLVIDYPRTRFAVIDEAALSGVAEHIAAVPAEVRLNKLFVPIESSGETYPDLFFDTGSSRFDLWVDKGLWTEITGLTEPVPGGPVFTGYSWGVKFDYHGAPATDLVIAGAPIADAITYYRNTEPVFEDYPHPAVGLFGNRPFLEKVVVADYGDSPSFGYLDCPDEPPAP